MKTNIKLNTNAKMKTNVKMFINTLFLLIIRNKIANIYILKIIYFDY